VSISELLPEERALPTHRRTHENS